VRRPTPARCKQLAKLAREDETNARETARKEAALAAARLVNPARGVVAVVLLGGQNNSSMEQ
jgi:hypothetical protein